MALIVQLSMAYKRQRRCKKIDESFASRGDAFRAIPTYMQKGYTWQVPAPPVRGVFADIMHQVHEGKIQMDTMILLDVSSSMGWEHTGFDQPRHVGA